MSIPTCFSLINIFALNIHRIHLQVSVDFEKAPLEKNNIAVIFHNKCEMKITYKGLQFETRIVVFKVQCLTTSQYDNYFLFF